MRLTVGPLPPAVYWRRRALVLGAALLLLFLVAQAGMNSAPADEPTSGPTPTGTPGPTTPAVGTSVAALPPEEDGERTKEPAAENPKAGDTPEPADPSICADDEILVTAVAERATFSVGESVQFTIRIAHDADRPCRRDIGGNQRELYLVVGSGADHVWSSRDCANPTGTQVQELTAGWEAKHDIAFTGVGGASCDTELEPGDFELYARLGTARSEPVTITLQ